MSEASKLDGWRVLVVEDEFYLADDFRKWLENAGAVVAGPTGNVAEAAVILGSEKPDAAVVDINLGYGPTFELASKLRAEGVPFIFATGYDEASIPAQHVNTPRLEKPFGPEQLVRAVSGLRT